MNRTNTTMLTTFRLPAPHEATITFPSDEIELEDSARIIVAVPKGSQWRMPLHWHPSTTLGCVSVRCLSGRVRVFQGNDKGSGERSISPDSRAVRFQPAQMVAWASPGTVRHRKGCEEDWSFEMVVANPNLYRNVSVYSPLHKLPSHLLPVNRWRVRFWTGISTRACRAHRCG